MLHKPIRYGGDVADGAFFASVVVHALIAAVAPVAGVVAMVAAKGKKLHVRAGKVFVWTMVITAITGIGVDVVRLFVAFAANHAKYPGASMPSTIPARLGFLFCAFGVLYLAYQASNREVFKQQPLAAPASTILVPAALLAGGAALTVLLFARFNPWSGALWMIWTFMAGVVVTAVLRRRQRTDKSAGVARHRFAMLFLFAFSGWGALQGFGPAIAVALKGVDDAKTEYVGHLPGAFTPFFFVYLVGWVPFFAIALLVVRRFARRHAARVRIAAP